MYGVGDLYSIIGRRDGEVYSNRSLPSTVRSILLCLCVWIGWTDGWGSMDDDGFAEGARWFP